MLENVFGENKKIRFTASLKNNLTSIGDVLDSLVWNSQVSKKQNSYNTCEDENLQEKYTEFKYLLNEFKKYFDEDDEETEPSYQ